MTKRNIYMFTRDEVDDMFFDLNDVIKVLKHYPISKEMLSDYPSDSISESTKTLFDLPKDFEGTQFTIGDCLESIRDAIEISDELY